MHIRNVTRIRPASTSDSTATFDSLMSLLETLSSIISFLNQFSALFESLGKGSE